MFIYKDFIKEDRERFLSSVEDDSEFKKWFIENLDKSDQYWEEVFIYTKLITAEFEAIIAVEEEYKKYKEIIQLYIKVRATTKDIDSLVKLTKIALE